MKIFTFLTALFAGVMLWGCADADSHDGDKAGYVVFDGKHITMKNPMFEENTTAQDKRALYDRWNIGYHNEKEYTIGVTNYEGTSGDVDGITSFYFTTPMPREDFDIDVASFSGSFCWRVYFLTGDKLYISRLVAVVPPTGSRVSSIGIDPSTGKEINIIPYPRTDEVDSMEIPDLGTITGGDVKVRWGDKTLSIDFDLRFDDGKRAKGRGEIPRGMIVL